MVTRAKKRWKSAWFVALCGLSACHEPRCEPEQACDIRKPFCQRRALKLAQCLRGDEGVEVRVKVETIERDALIDAWTREEEDARDKAEAEGSPERLLKRGLSLFKLAELRDARTDTEAYVDTIGAYYEPHGKRIVIVDRGGALDAPGQLFMLVHEMVHALQDATYAFAGSESVTTHDAQLARSALIEGEATVLVDELIADGMGFDFHDIDYARSLRSYRASALLNAVRNPSVFDTLGRHFVYAYGASYLWDKPGYRSNVRQAYKSPPVSTHAVMTGDTSRSEERVDDLGEYAAPVIEGLGAPVHVRLGRFAYEVFVRKIAWYQSRFPIAELAATGADFEADTLSVFENGDDIIASLRLRFAGEDSAKMLEQVFDEVFGQPDTRPWAQETQGRVGRDGRDVYVLMPNLGVLDFLPEELAWTAVSGPDVGFAMSAGAAHGRFACLAHELR